MTITKKGEKLYLKKRVPARFRGVEPREVIWISLRADSPSEALARSGEAWAQMVLG